MATNKGIKVRISDGNGGYRHINWMPKPGTIMACSGAFIGFVISLILNASALAFRWDQVPKNTEWIKGHEKSDVLTKDRLDSMCQLMKEMYLKIDPVNAPSTIQRLEQHEKSLKESLDQIGKVQEVNGYKHQP